MTSFKISFLNIIFRTKLLFDGIQSINFLLNPVYVKTITLFINQSDVMGT